jgi:PadR family transcriptional regulator, regulatory protein PadR
VVLFIVVFSQEKGPAMDRFSAELMRGSLDLMVLSVLMQGPHYGYSLQQRLREVTSGRVPLPAGTLYPLLHRLETEKLIRSRWDESSGRRRKWYEITKSGRARLGSQAGQWLAYAECIRSLLDAVPGLTPAPA